MCKNGKLQANCPKKSGFDIANLALQSPTPSKSPPTPVA
jgi:hypothetical protein